MKPLQRVIKRESIPVRVTVPKGARYRLTLECGHAVERLGSERFPSVIRCQQCPSLPAKVGSVLDREAEHD